MFFFYSDKYKIFVRNEVQPCPTGCNDCEFIGQDGKKLQAHAESIETGRSVEFHQCYGVANSHRFTMKICELAKIQYIGEPRLEKVIFDIVGLPDLVQSVDIGMIPICNFYTGRELAFGSITRRLIGDDLSDIIFMIAHESFFYQRAGLDDARFDGAFLLSDMTTLGFHIRLAHSLMYRTHHVADHATRRRVTEFLGQAQVGRLLVRYVYRI